MYVSQCSLQSPSVLRMKTMDSSTEGSQQTLPVTIIAPYIRQTSAHKNNDANTFCDVLLHTSAKVSEHE